MWCSPGTSRPFEAFSNIPPIRAREVQGDFKEVVPRNVGRSTFVPCTKKEQGAMVDSPNCLERHQPDESSDVRPHWKKEVQPGQEIQWFARHCTRCNPTHGSLTLDVQSQLRHRSAIRGCDSRGATTCRCNNFPQTLSSCS